MVAVAYALVCVLVGPGLDLAAGDAKELGARLVTMYLMTVAVSLIVRFERAQRQAAMEGERRMQQERIDLSQSIHDTVAQTAYMIGLGIDGAIRLAGDANPRLVERLTATSELSKSAMWELRRPIDVGRLFEGQQIGPVLRSHAATFAADAVRLFVSDDGVGLPSDYAERGRGFGGMERDARRLGGRLIVETGEPDVGTTVTCVAPYATIRTGDYDGSD